MRVLIISHTYISPINRDKWKTLAKRHADCFLSVIFPKHWPTHLFAHEAIIAPEENSNNCTFSALDTHHQGNELLYRYNHKQLYAAIKAHNPDIIQIEQGVSAISYLQANLYAKMLRTKAKSIFFTWVNWNQKNSLKHRFFFTPIEKINKACAAAAITGNHAAKEILQKHGFAKPILVLPQLGVNTHIFTPRNKTKSGTKYLCFVGRITPEKGVFLLAEAFCKIQTACTNWKLLFVGDGPAYTQLHDFVTRNNLLACVEFHKPVPHHDIAHILKTVDILILPSYDTPDWREQFGHVLIEAMACKIPVIGSNAGEIPHVIGDSGLIFEQKNTASLLAQLQRLMHDEEAREKIGNKGYLRVLEQYTHESIADRTHTFWQQVLGYK